MISISRLIRLHRCPIIGFVMDWLIFFTDRCSVVSQISFKDGVVLKDYGAPQMLSVNFTVTSEFEKPGMFILSLKTYGPWKANSLPVSYP